MGRHEGAVSTSRLVNNTASAFIDFQEALRRLSQLEHDDIGAVVDNGETVRSARRPATAKCANPEALRQRQLRQICLAPSGACVTRSLLSILRVCDAPVAGNQV